MSRTAFTTLTSPAAPIAEDNVDTDAILPARFLLMLDRAKASEGLFADRRRDEQGRERPEFPLNRPIFRQARIIIAGANFGCGSSREQAPWALADNGVRCVIARSFGEIFHANCIRNAILPIVLDEEAHRRLSLVCADGRPVTVDLQACVITAEGMEPIGFPVDAAARASLLNGWDETSTILRLYADDIAAFEAAQARRKPWLYDDALLASALPRAEAGLAAPTTTHARD